MTVRGRASGIDAIRDDEGGAGTTPPISEA